MSVSGTAVAAARDTAESPMITTPAILPSYDYDASDQPLLGETIGENFNRMATTHTDREALVDLSTGRRWTYAELHRDVLALAHGLLRLGIDKGDRVGIWAPTRPEWTLMQFATAEIGAILVPINPAYRTDELAYVVRQAGIRLLVAAPSFRTSDYAAMIEDARPGCPDLRWVILLGTADWDALPDRAGDPGTLAARQALLSPDDPINIQYTSGTTGHPKGAALSHHNILNNAYLTGEVWDTPELDRVCVPVPLYHTLRHGDRQPRGHHPRRLPGLPGTGLRRVGHADGCGTGALYVAVRRARDVHRRAGRSRVRCLRPAARCAPGPSAARPARSKS